MGVPRLIMCSAAALGVSLATAQAGSCGPQIDAMQARLDARLAAIAAAGPAGKQSLNADLSRQPTPHSIAVAEERLGELNQHMVRSVRRALNRARAADARGNAKRCERELAIAERALGP